LSNAQSTIERYLEKAAGFRRRHPSGFECVGGDVGMNLPHTWSLVDLGDIAEPEKGAIRRGPFGGSLKKEIFVESGFKVYEQQNAIKDNFQIGNYFIDEDKFREMEGFSVKPNDLIISCAGTIGKVAIVPNEALPGVINQALMRIRPNTEIILCRYLKWLLEAPKYQRDIFGKSAGSALKNLAAISEIKQCKIPLPPLEEQRRIAVILDKADGVRRKRKEAIALTEDLLRSTFLEMFGDPVTNPKGWELVELGKLLTFLTSGSRGWAKYYAKEGSLFLRIQNVKDGRLLLDDIAFVNAPDSAESRRTSVQEGDVLVSITADLGRTAVIPKGLGKAHINQHLALLRLNKELISPEYAAAFLASIGGQLQFDRLNREGVKAGLNFDDLRGLEILLPPLEKQMEYSKFLQSQTEALEKQATGCVETENLFNSLLQRAFCGEL
jgi:type I restriction enzyme, S subunit